MPGRHGQGVLFAGLQDGKTAALALPREVSELGAQNRNQLTEIGASLPGFRSRHHDLRGPEDIAAVERRNLEARERPLNHGLELLDPEVLEQDPEQVLDLHRSLILQPLFRQVFPVDLVSIRGIRDQAVVGLGHHALAGAAYRHDREAEFFGLSKRSRIDGICDVLGENARAVAAHVFELLELDSESISDLQRGWIKLRAAALGDTS